MQKQTEKQPHFTRGNPPKIIALLLATFFILVSIALFYIYTDDLYQNWDKKTTSGYITQLEWRYEDQGTDARGDRQGYFYNLAHINDTVFKVKIDMFGISGKKPGFKKLEKILQEKLQLEEPVYEIDFTPQELQNYLWADIRYNSQMQILDLEVNKEVILEYTPWVAWAFIIFSIGAFIYSVHLFKTSLLLES